MALFVNTLRCMAQFRCVGCPKAWCEDCLPDEDKIEPIGDTNPYLEERGFGYVKQAYYIKCDGEPNSAASSARMRPFTLSSVAECIHLEQEIGEGRVVPKPEPVEVPEDDYAPPVKAPRGARKPRAPRGSKKDAYYDAYKPPEVKVEQTKMDREARMRQREARKSVWQEDFPEKDQVVGAEDGDV